MKQNICPLCGESIDEETDILHKEVDEWLLQMVLKEHPDWQQSDGACEQCWEAIGRMKREADELLDP